MAAAAVSGSVPTQSAGSWCLWRRAERSLGRGSGTGEEPSLAPAPTSNCQSFSLTVWRLVLVCFFFNLRLTASKEQEEKEQLPLCSSSWGTRTVLTPDWLRMEKNFSDSSSRGIPAACPGERMITEEGNTQTNSFIFTASLGHA